MLSAAHIALGARPEQTTGSAVFEQRRRDLEALQQRSSKLHDFIRDRRRLQLGRVGPEDPGSSVRVLGELDIINAYERIRSYYLNIAETLYGGKR